MLHYFGYSILALLLVYFIRRDRQTAKALRETQDAIPKQLKKAREDALSKSRMVINANITEELSSLIPGFPYNGRDCQHFGSPYDFVVIDGMSTVRDSGRGKIKEIIFLDVKTGNAVLTPVEQKIKECIQDKRVRWETLRLIPDQGYIVVPPEEDEPRKKRLKTANEIIDEKYFPQMVDIEKKE